MPSKDRFFILLYFAIGFIEVIAEMFAFSPLIVVLKPLLPALLILIYLQTSERRNWVFVLTMSLSIITNILFIPDDGQMLYYGIIAFLVHRLLVIYLIALLVKINDFVPMFIGTIPFLLVFFYLFMITDEIPENSFYILIMQNLLISVLGGIAVSNYIMNDSKKNSWLLLCGLLFVLLQLIIFIERYYLSQFSTIFLRPVAMALNIVAFYTFYEFVVAAEKSDDDAATV